MARRPRRRTCRDHGFEGANVEAYDAQCAACWYISKAFNRRTNKAKRSGTAGRVAAKRMVAAQPHVARCRLNGEENAIASRVDPTICQACQNVMWAADKRASDRSAIRRDMEGSGIPLLGGSSWR